MQTEYFFPDTLLTFFRFQLQNSVHCIRMFVIYPQAAQTQHLTVDFDFVCDILLSAKYTKIKHRNKRQLMRSSIESTVTYRAFAACT